jgi:hypothetical protein
MWIDLIFFAKIKAFLSGEGETERFGDFVCRLNLSKGRVPCVSSFRFMHGKKWVLDDAIGLRGGFHT